MLKILFAFAAAMVLSACATNIDWAATGGSRADGVVRLSYEIGEFQTAQLNEQQAVSLATKRCQTWGYSGSEAFGGVTRQCNQWGGFGGCARWLVTKEFQCTGTGAGTHSGQVIGPAPVQTPVIQQHPVAVGVSSTTQPAKTTDGALERDPAKRCDACEKLTVP